MEIIVASTAGFCFGVHRAVDSVYQNINGKPLYTYGPIIHNQQVVEELEKKGVRPIKNFDDISNLSKGIIIIRSHGVGENIYTMMESRGLSYIDSTCPYVKRIHHIVQRYFQEGYQIVIVGDPHHPEVQGINGWNNDEGVVLQTIEEAEKFNLPISKQLCIVAQTTYKPQVYEEIVTILENKGYELKRFHTICNATEVRQEEAARIAKEVDKMIVIGGKHSSNTKKLYEICKEWCEKTYYIETPQELELNLFQPNDRIGITAGASTPKKIIEEVINVMSDMHNNQETQMSFEELLEESLNQGQIRSRQVLTGTVIDVGENEVVVNLGYKSDGIITKSEFSSNPHVELTKEVQPGDEIEVYVLKVNDQEGQVLLSKKRLAFQKGWDTIQEAYEAKTVIKGKIVDVVRGGVIALVEEIRVFIPASQLADHYINDLTQFLNIELEFKIIEFDRRRRKVVGSHKEIMAKEKAAQKEKLFNSLEVDSQVKGTVKRLTDFGAFVDLGGIDGLLHISELSWGHVKHPKKVLVEGQEITVRILEIDKENEKISLSLKTPENNPWNNADTKYAPGTVIEGNVVRIVSFGAFVELEPGVDGLIHISQIAKKHVEKVEDELKVGQFVTAQIIDLNIDEKRISLSMKALEEDSEEVAQEVVEKAQESVADEDQTIE